MTKLATYSMKMKVLLTNKIVEIGHPSEYGSDEQACDMFEIYINNFYGNSLKENIATFTLIKNDTEVIATLPE